MFGASIALQQGSVSITDLGIVDVEDVPNGTLVLAEAVPPSGPKAELAFFLKRATGQWRIYYDNFTANAIAAYVQQQEQRRIDPDAKQPSPEALAAADRVVARFREAALGPRRPAGAPSDEATTESTETATTP